MIKCSICSYQYDNWYASKSSTSVHKIFIRGSDHWACSIPWPCCTIFALPIVAAHPSGCKYENATTQSSHNTSSNKFSIRTNCHTFSAFWLWSSVVSVLISMTTDMGSMRSLSMSTNFYWWPRSFSLLLVARWRWVSFALPLTRRNRPTGQLVGGSCCRNRRSCLRKSNGEPGNAQSVSQRSLQIEPIFRLLLKVAVIGAYQCEYITIFFGALPQPFAQLGPGAAGVVCTEISAMSWLRSPQLTWLALGEDQAARSRRVEQLMALWGL